jgi:outer membrane lipoprotein-sorting protein
MKCSELYELISAYADGELNQTQRQFVEEHLNGCPDCRALLAVHNRTRRQIGTLRQLAAVPGIKEQVMSKTRTKKCSRRIWSIPFWVRVTASGVLVAVLAFYISGLFGNGSPADFTSRVYAATEKLTSYRIMISTYANSGEDVVASQQLEVSYLSPSFYHIKDSTTCEIILDGDNAYALTPELTGANGILQYGSSGASQTQLQFNLMLSKEDTLALIDTLVNVKKLSDEEMDGVACFHYRGDVDVVRYMNNYKAKLIEQYPEMADVLDREWEYFTEAWAEVNEQIELWVGKDDYLIRQTELNVLYPDPTMTALQICRYSYPSNLVIPSAVGADGKTLPGWYLIADSTFSIDSMFTTTQPSGEQIRHSDTRIDILNIGQQEYSDVRVYVATRDRLELAAPWDIYEATPDTSDVNLAPGEQQIYHAVWDYISSGPMSIGPSVQVFVEYTTSDGMNCVALLSPQTG